MVDYTIRSTVVQHISVIDGSAECRELALDNARTALMSAYLVTSVYGAEVVDMDEDTSPCHRCYYYLRAGGKCRDCGPDMVEFVDYKEV